jgi:di/tricarboxylate transporter
MNADLAIVLSLLAAAVAMFAINKPRMDAVALIMLTVLPFTGVITMGEALSGFSDPNIVLIAALFAMIVALAASAAFMTPISSPVNTLVVGPGNYTFGDFVKVGVPFTLVVMVVCVIMVPILLPLYK